MQSHRQPPIDPQALRAFVTVAREGNVSRAAQKLHRSQPAVSLQLKALAEVTGLMLLERTRHGMTLTPDGALLLPLADKALTALGEFANTAAALHSTVRGQLSIGTILDPEFTRLGAFLIHLVRNHPLINTALHHDISGKILALIDSGDLDVGFFLDVPDDPVGAPMERRVLTRFTYRVLAPAGWGPQVQNKDWKALAALPWLATPPSSVHNRLQRRVFGPNSLSGLEPPRVALVDQEASMLDLVRSGAGLSLVRDSIAIREAQARGLAIADRVSLDCELSFVCRAERRTEPVIAAAWSALDEIWA